MRGKDGKGPAKDGPKWTPDEGLDAAGVPPSYRVKVELMLVTAKFVAVVEQVLRENGGQPIRVSADRISEILAMTADTPLDRLVGLQSVPTEDGEDFLFSLADPADLRDGFLRDARRHALHRMGPSRN